VAQSEFDVTNAIRKGVRDGIREAKERG